MKKKNKITIPKQISLRNFFAIVLTLISVFCLFWPPVVKYSSKFLEINHKATASNYQSRYGYSEADSLELAEVEDVHTSFSVLDALGNAHRDAVQYDIFEKSTHKYHVMGTSAESTAISVVAHFLFFGIILTGLAACVCYFLNLTRALGIAHAALCLVVLIMCGIQLLFVRSAKDVLSPTVGMFALPLLAAAGCLLYKPEMPVKEPAPDPVANTPKTPETWICSKCGIANPLDEMYCVSCGMPQSAKRTFCSNCGAPLRPGAPFCTKCGKKQ